MKAAKTKKEAPVMEINEYLKIAEIKGEKVIQCRCGHLVGPASENFKNHVLRKDFPLTKAGPWVATYKTNSPFVFREFYCPNCKTLLETEVALKQAPVLWDVQPKA